MIDDNFEDEEIQDAKKLEKIFALEKNKDLLKIVISDNKKFIDSVFSLSNNNPDPYIINCYPVPSLFYVGHRQEYRSYSIYKYLEDSYEDINIVYSEFPEDATDKIVHIPLRETHLLAYSIIHSYLNSINADGNMRNLEYYATQFLDHALTLAFLITKKHYKELLKPRYNEPEYLFLFQSLELVLNHISFGKTEFTQFINSLEEYDKTAGLIIQISDNSFTTVPGFIKRDIEYLFFHLRESQQDNVMCLVKNAIFPYQLHEGALRNSFSKYPNAYVKPFSWSTCRNPGTRILVLSSQDNRSMAMTNTLLDNATRYYYESFSHQSDTNSSHRLGIILAIYSLPKLDENVSYLQGAGVEILRLNRKR